MELFRLLGTIAIDSDGAKKAINETTGIASNAGGKISSALGKIGGAAVKVGKVCAAGLAVGATAIAGLAKVAVDSYADYEQLVGGVETLFGTGGQSMVEYAKSVGKSVAEIKDEYNSMMAAQETVLNNASVAYKTAGMSANEYMETVTGFSASLIQSLNGNTEAAAEKANQAIIDMADNANKMGSSLESIQNAYGGFAKQNYTMLDNLKLGYGGTKEEMQRLLNDAQKFSGIKYDISSYADVVDAIHVIQEEMGIAGTTAKEASETISGSGLAMKAAWQNLMTGMADEDADINRLLDNLFVSVGNFAKNIIPRVEVTLQGIGNAIQKGLPKALNMIVPMLERIVPQLLTGAVSLLNQLTSTIGKGLPKLLKMVVSLVKNLLPQLVEIVISLIGSLASAIYDILPDLVDGIFEILGSLFDSKEGVLGQLLTKVMGEDAMGTLSETFGKVGEAVEPLWQAIQNLGGALSSSASETSFFGNLFSAMANTISLAWNSIGQPVFDAITTGINWLAENWASVSSGISSTFSVLWSVCQSVWQNIGQPIWDLIQFAVVKVQGLFAENMPAIMATFQSVVTGIKDSWNNHLKPALNAIGLFLNYTLKPAFEFVFDTIIKPLVEHVFGSIKDLWEGTLKPVFDGICDFLLGVFTLDFETAFNGIGSIVEGVFNGIQTTVETVIGTVVDILDNAIGKIKEFLGFAEDAGEVEMHESVSGTSHGGGGGKRGGASTSGTEYYADGAVLTKATAFGLNPFNGKTMVGGEAGAEAIAPISTLQSYIADAVGAKDEAFLLAIERIIDNQTNAIVAAILALQESGIIKLDDPYRLFKLVKEQQRRQDLKTT
ncbi:MAG: hypothetical protein IJZ23_06860 [Roseburia sp.]|nr:hypothetical protein [Roseburia sp.]MBQ8279545.1 hypothetical protein [Roseburia sp.]